MKSYTIVFSKPTSTGNYFTKLQFKGQASTDMGVFGQNVSNKQETFFVFGNTQMQQGSAVQINPAQWKITEKDYAIPTTGEVIKLKYLTEFVG